ncbi:MAG: DUF3368 domain-containing protein [bacterium]
MKVVVNSTPLISLAILDKLSLLDELFQEVYIPPAVFKETTKKGKKKARAIENWGKNKISNALNFSTKEALEITLDEGESEVIALAQKINANLVIIDEEKARNIARLYNMNVTGTIGVLIFAREQGKLTAIKPLLDKLINNGIYISVELYNRACSKENQK